MEVRTGSAPLVIKRAKLGGLNHNDVVGEVTDLLSRNDSVLYYAYSPSFSQMGRPFN